MEYYDPAHMEAAQSKHNQGTTGPTLSLFFILLTKTVYSKSKMLRTQVYNLSDRGYITMIYRLLRIKKQNEQREG